MPKSENTPSSVQAGDASSEAPILIFDTGVGALTVLAELRKIMPAASIILAADQAGLPYGTKSESQITSRVAGLLGRMSERYNPCLICIACNTASTIALDMVRDVLEVPIVGTVPAIKPAAAMSKTGTIGLLGTQATIRQSYVDRLEAEFAIGKKLLRHGAPELVAPAEAKMRGRPVDQAAIQSAVDGLRNQPDGEKIDTVVLACTHFPLLAEELSNAFGPNVTLVDGATGIARRIANLCGEDTFSGPPALKAVTTGQIDEFRQVSAVLSSYGIDQIDQF